MNASPTCETGELSRHWRVVAASFMGLVCAVGTIVTYTAGVFSVAIGRDFGWTIAQFTIPIMFFYYSLVPGAILCGRLVDAYGPRRLIIASNIALAAGLVGIGLLPASLPLFCLAYAVLGLVSIGTLPVAYARVIAGCFEKRRGAALGISLTGVGVGGAVLPVLAQAIIAHWGWRFAMVGLASMVAMFALTSARAFIPRDATDGVRSTQSSSSLGSAWLQARRAILGLGLISLVCGIVLTGLVVNMVPIAVSKGIGDSGIVAVGVTMGISVILGRLGIGLLMDRYSAKNVLGLFLLGPILGAILLATQSEFATLLAGVALVGLAQGAEVDAVAYLVSRHFSPDSFGTIYGIMFALFTVGAANGPLVLAQLSADGAGYHFGLLIFAILGAFCAIISFLLPQYRILK